MGIDLSLQAITRIARCKKILTNTHKRFSIYQRYSEDSYKLH
jgi:hypothetical protein